MESNTFNLILSIGAFSISLFSLVVSFISFREQIFRERREELRGIVERLINIGIAINKTSKIEDDIEREQEGATLNWLKSIYLESAEILVGKLNGKVSTGELNRIAYENEMQSDFKEARRYYKMSTQVAKKSSLVNQSIAFRMYAANFYVIYSKKEVEEGRKHFQKSLDILKAEADYYSIYSYIFGLRYWVGKEAGMGNLDFAADLLLSGIDRINTLPDWYNLKKDERKFYAQQIASIASQFLDKNDPQFESKVSQLYDSGVKLLEGLNDVFAFQIKNNLALQQARLLENKGENPPLQLYRAAEEYLRSLPPFDPYRLQWMPFVKKRIPETGDGKP